METIMSNSEPPPVYLTDDQLGRLAQYAVAQQVQRGDVLIEPNDVDYDLIVVETGWVELTIAAVGEPDAVVARFDHDNLWVNWASLQGNQHS